MSVTTAQITPYPGQTINCLYRLCNVKGWLPPGCGAWVSPGFFPRLGTIENSSQNFPWATPVVVFAVSNLCHS